MNKSSRTILRLQLDIFLFKLSYFSHLNYRYCNKSIITHVFLFLLSFLPVSNIYPSNQLQKNLKFRLQLSMSNIQYCYSPYTQKSKQNVILFFWRQQHALGTCIRSRFHQKKNAFYSQTKTRKSVFSWF